MPHTIQPTNSFPKCERNGCVVTNGSNVLGNIIKINAPTPYAALENNNNIPMINNKNDLPFFSNFHTKCPIWMML